MDESPRAALVLVQEFMDVEGRVFGWPRKPARDALLHLGHQNMVAEALPTLLRIVDGDNRPAPRREVGGVKDLAFGQAVFARVNGGNRSLVSRTIRRQPRFVGYLVI
jgi:hypothetical protein